MQDIDPALLAYSPTDNETHVTRAGSTRVAIGDMSIEIPTVSPPSERRASLNRAASAFDPLVTSQGEGYYGGNGSYQAGNANPLCLRPTSSQLGYGMYHTYSQANPMYFHNHGGHSYAAPPMAVDPHRMQYTGDNNNSYQAASNGEANNSSNYRGN
jgi:hypothetical protein